MGTKEKSPWPLGQGLHAGTCTGGCSASAVGDGRSAGRQVVIGAELIDLISVAPEQMHRHENLAGIGHAGATGAHQAAKQFVS